MSAPFKLTSIAQLQSELSARRAKLAELQRLRDHEQAELNTARQEHARLGARVHALETEIGQKGQAIFVLLSELDHLLLLDSRIKTRAMALAKNVEAPPPSPQNRRAYTRSPLATEITLGSDTNFYVGFSEDISQGGLFVATTDTRRIGERFPIQFKLPRRSESIQCMVEVAWVREYHEGLKYAAGDVPGMGLKFIGLDDADAKAIDAFRKEREPLFFPELDALA